MTGDSAPEGVDLGGWSREWGLVVPDGNPDEVGGIEDLIDGDLRFINRTTDAGLRSTFEGAVETLADERGVERRELTNAIDGFDLSVRAHESPARKVRSGKRDVGLGLRTTADRLGMGFVPCGTEHVSVVADPDRAEKPGVKQLEAAIDGGENVFETLAGYSS